MTAGGAIGIRAVEGRHRAALADIIGRSGNLNEEEKACALELLDIYLNDPRQEDYSFLAAFAGGADAPSGYICYGRRPLAEGVYDIYWIVVDPEKRRSGAGRALLGRVLGLMASAGARMAVAETSGTAAYQAARAFYLGCGFSEEARIEGFYRPGDDMVVYIKRF